MVSSEIGIYKSTQYALLGNKDVLQEMLFTVFLSVFLKPDLNSREEECSDTILLEE